LNALRPRVPTLLAFAAAAVLLAGCDSAPGRPAKDSETLAPGEILEFNILFSDNCAGCHGADGRGGAALSLSDPVYLAVADDDTIRHGITNGVKGTSMAAFGQSAGGMLTSKQIDVLVSQIRARWAKPGILGAATPPSYVAKAPGDATRGEAVYKTYCESCHGPNGRGGQKGSSITDDSFLALLSDQELRTMVIVGRPDRGAPDWRNNLPGKPMSDQEITDVVSWLASKRVSSPGQPYPTPGNTHH
jgi:mono/diheme cytochrome c family protein